MAIPELSVPHVTAMVAAWVRDAIASEIIEAGVVAGLLGGMREGMNWSITCFGPH